MSNTSAPKQYACSNRKESSVVPQSAPHPRRRHQSTHTYMSGRSLTLRASSSLSGYYKRLSRLGHRKATSPSVNLTTGRLMSRKAPISLWTHSRMAHCAYISTPPTTGLNRAGTAGVRPRSPSPWLTHGRRQDCETMAAETEPTSVSNGQLRRAITVERWNSLCEQLSGSISSG